MAQPRILAALLDGVTEALRRRDIINPGELPRLADFARFAIAAETAYWREGTFMAAFKDSRIQTVTETVASDEAVDALLTLMEDETEPLETHLQTLLSTLSEQVGERAAKARSWPQTSRALQERLKKMAPFLAELGFFFRFEGRDKNGSRITVWKKGMKEPAADEKKKTKTKPPATERSTTSATAETVEANAGHAVTSRINDSFQPFKLTNKLPPPSQTQTPCAMCGDTHEPLLRCYQHNHSIEQGFWWAHVQCRTFLQAHHDVHLLVYDGAPK